MNEAQKRYGFWSILSLITGSVIGVGVFFKNAGVIKAAGYNPVIALISWGLVSLLVLATVMAYIEISSSTKEERGTLANWGSKFISEKTGKTFQVFFAYLWSPVMIILLALLSGDFFLQGFGVKENMDPALLPYAQMGLAIVIAGSLFAANAINAKIGKGVATSTMLIKMIPLLTVLVLGLLTGAGLAFTSDTITTGAGTVDEVTKAIEFDPILILAAAPGILFAFDGFIFAANLQKEAKTKQTFKKALLIGMIGVSAFYLLLATGLFLGDQEASIENTLIAALPDHGANLWKLTSIFIGISALGVTNANIITGTRNILDGQESGRLTRIKGVDEHNMNKAYGVLAAFTGLWLIIGMAGGLLNAGEDPVVNFLDTFSNSVVIGGYLIYVIVVLGALANRFNNKVAVEKEKVFIPAAIISIVGFGTIILYNLANSVLAGDTNSKFIISAAIITVLLVMFNSLTTEGVATPDAKQAAAIKKSHLGDIVKIAKDKAVEQIEKNEKVIEIKKSLKAATNKPAAKKATATKKPAAKKAPAKK